MRTTALALTLLALVLGPALAIADDLDDAAMETAAAQNARAPFMLDRVNRFDKAFYANRTLVLTYTATNGPANRFSKSQVAQAGRRLKETLANQNCADTISRGLLDRGVTFLQKIFANDGVLLVEVSLSKADCNPTPGGLPASQ